jgi:hypothetical protein
MDVEISVTAEEAGAPGVFSAGGFTSVSVGMPRGADPEMTAGPGGFANSAFISVGEADDTVTVGISVGDPRGAFTMTIRRIDGQLYLYVPAAGDPGSHVELSRIREGAYRIGG